MRELLYAAYLRFPRAFYDRHPTGQVVSRATNDLYPIRYFIGWGLVQGAQSVMMLVGAGIVLASPTRRSRSGARCRCRSIAARGLALRAPRDADLARGPAAQGRRHRVGERGRGRHRDGAGVRARGRRAASASPATPDAVRDEVLRQARVESHHLPGLFFLPSLSVAVVLLLGGSSVIEGSLTYGEFALFIQLLLQLVWPLESIGWIINLGQRALASASRCFAWLDRVADAARSRAPGADTGPSACRLVRGRPLRLPRRGGGAPRRRPRVEPGEVSRSRDRPAPASRLCSTWFRASTTRPAEPCGSAASTCGTLRSRPPRADLARHPAADSVLGDLRENLSAAARACRGEVVRGL